MDTAEAKRVYTAHRDRLKRALQAGVPIVAGTDGFGIEIVHELEIYLQAGLSAAEALATATIGPARPFALRPAVQVP